MLSHLISGVVYLTLSVILISKAANWMEYAAISRDFSERAPERAPDAECVTTADGACISSGACMHGPPTSTTQDSQNADH